MLNHCNDIIKISPFLLLAPKKSLELVNQVISYLRFKDDGSAASENDSFTVRSHAMHCAKIISPRYKVNL